MCLIHKWEYHGKQYGKKQQHRTCQKCQKTETLHHLLRAGISYYFYDEIKQKPPYEEIKRKEKVYIYLFFSCFLALVLLIVLVGNTKLLEGHISFGEYSISFEMILLLACLLYIAVLYKSGWKIWELYGITVDSEEIIEDLYPTHEERFRESQIKAEKILMYRLSTGEITKEEYTAKMARL